MHANVLPFYTTLTPVWGQKVKTFFSEEGLWCTSHYAIKMFDIMHTPGFFGWIKGQTLNCADKYNLTELSDLMA